METILTYLVQSSLSVAVLSIAYKVLFSNQATFKINRIILLAILSFGFIGLPAISNLFSLLQTLGQPLPAIGISGKALSIGLQEITITAGLPANNHNLISIIITIYMAGVLFMLLRFSYTVLKLFHIYNSSEKIKAEYYTLVLLDKNNSTFSFFGLLFINKSLYAKNQAKQIINHETVHIRQKHSIDVLLAELLIILQWFNPFAYILKKLISENHEYLADRGTIASANDISAYKILVLNHSIKQQTSFLINNFSYLLIKKRIKMMEKSKSKLSMMLSMVAFTFVFATVMLSCNNKSIETEPVQEKQQPRQEAVKPEQQKLPIVDERQSAENDSVYIVVEKMPEFPGGRKAFMKYLSDNIKYPQQAKKDSIQGRVFINFTVEKDGSISNVNILRGIGGGCDQEAVRVVKAMPRWIPGEQDGETVRVDFNLPVKFVLD